MNLVVLGVLCYIVAQLGVAFAVSRSVRTEEDYLVAGRRLGYGLTTFTVFATWFGAETCIGSAGAVYTDGLEGGTSDPFGYAGCLLLAGLLLAAPLWRRKITTLADLFRRRYSPGVERLTVLLMVPTSLMWAAAQIRALLNSPLPTPVSRFTPAPALVVDVPLPTEQPNNAALAAGNAQFLNAPDIGATLPLTVVRPTLEPTPDGTVRTAHVPILMYHYLSEPPADADIYRRDLSVAPVLFAEHLARRPAKAA